MTTGFAEQQRDVFARDEDGLFAVKQIKLKPMDWYLESFAFLPTFLEVSYPVILFLINAVQKLSQLLFNK